MTGTNALTAASEEPVEPAEAATALDVVAEPAFEVAVAPVLGASVTALAIVRPDE